MISTAAAACQASRGGETQQRKWQFEALRLRGDSEAAAEAAQLLNSPKVLQWYYTSTKRVLYRDIARGRGQVPGAAEDP